MKTRQYLWGEISNLRKSRAMWRGRYETLKDTYAFLLAYIKRQQYKIKALECEIEQLKKEESKKYGWQAYSEMEEKSGDDVGN